jgi:hypothetical protein
MWAEILTDQLGVQVNELLLGWSKDVYHYEREWILL